MKVYNVSVYYVDMFHEKYKLEMFKDKNKEMVHPFDIKDYPSFIYVDNIMVTRNAFNTREIITKQPIKLFSTNPRDIEYYDKYGFVLGTKSISLSEKNVVIPKTIEKYRDSFLESDYLKFLRYFENDGIDQDIVDYRINKVLKKMKDWYYENI